LLDFTLGVGDCAWLAENANKAAVVIIIFFM
jgi:hypothetical protein